MSEVAQLSIPEEFYDGDPTSEVAIDGDIVVVTSPMAAYIFVKPSGGWATTSAYNAILTPPNGLGVSSIAISGDTIVVGASSPGGSVEGAAYVFEKPAKGWVTTAHATATLIRSNQRTQDLFGATVAISGNTIAVAAPYTQNASSSNGAVDLFVSPGPDWADATETAELIPPLFDQGVNSLFGAALALDGSHLVVSSDTSTTYVYSKPATGWASGAWPSQQFSGGNLAGSGIPVLGTSIALEGDLIVAGAPFISVDGDDIRGAVYVFTLFPNGIGIPTNVVNFPEMNLGSSSDVVPLTITNAGTGQLNFTTLVSTTLVSSSNYKVLQTAANTCRTGAPAGQNCVLPIQFDPPGVGIHTDFLTLTSPSSASVRVLKMRGVANGVGAASEGILDFGTLTYGATKTLPLVVTNFGVPGSPTVAASFNNRSYSLASGGTCAAGVASGTTCTLMIKFSPDGVGEHDGAITLTPSSGGTSSVVVRGVGLSN